MKALSLSTRLALAEVRLLMGDAYTGQIILHCNGGAILKIEKREHVRPGDIARAREELSLDSEAGSM